MSFSSRQESVEFGTRLQTLESIRDFVSAKIRNNAQNKVLLENKNSNDFLINQLDFERIVRTEKFSNYIFALFDPCNSGHIETSSITKLIKFNIGHKIDDKMGQSDDNKINGTWKEIVPQSKLDSHNLHNAFNNDWILSQLWSFILSITSNQRTQCCDSGGKESNGKNNIKINEVTVCEFMTFVTDASLPRSLRKISTNELNWLKRNYKISECEDGKEGITRKDFSKNMPGKDEHLKDRVFTIFDDNKDGCLSVDEYIENLRRFTNKDNPDESIRFLFKIFDIDETGQISEEEFLKSLRGAVKNNGMSFDETELKQLTSAFWSETETDGDKKINYNEFRERILKHPGLPEKLSKSIMKCVAPKDVRKAEPTPIEWMQLEGYKRYFTSTFWRENYLLAGYILLFIIAQLVMIIVRVCQYKDFKNQDGSSPNVYYIIARATGFCLDVDNIFLVLMVLRWAITKLRCLGLGSYIPLDNNIYIHKFIAFFIFLHATIHTLAHLLNFAINVQPDPVRFAYLNGITEPYNPPPNCKPNINGTSQECTNSDDKWTYTEWIFTAKPNCFGLIHGAANPTGVFIYLTLVIIVLASLPCVRRSGKFELFRWTHWLIWVYWILLFCHCPNFWKYFIAPLILYMFEIVRKITSTRMSGGAGCSSVHAGLRLPSRVINLIIRRPEKFNFCPGDWVFVKIPDIASQEWHPFTISSAPEQKDFFTLHIRAVGGWTNRLYDYYDGLNKDKGTGTDESLYKYYMRYLKAGLDGNVDRNDKVEKVPSELQIDASALKDPTGNDIVSKHKKRQFYCSTPLQIRIDGPYGAPASNIFRASHAVLVATGIGVTPFSSILQSIMFRYWQSKSKCPNCQHTWTSNMTKMEQLKKVDFFWINRDQVSFEWFIHLLNELELEQAEKGGEMERFLDLHLYMTAMKDYASLEAFGLQMALDSVYKMEKRDLITGLKTRTKAGRPNWDEVFLDLKNQNKGPITVFYCGNPYLAKTLRTMCEKYEFQFRKEVF